MGASTRPVALVTGASGGIGAAIAGELARDGFDLILTGRNVAAMKVLDVQLTAAGASVRVVQCDLARRDAVSELVTAIGGTNIDVLINNAGVGYSVAFTDSEDSRQAALMQLNVVATTELSRRILPGMVARGRGRMMLVASLGAFVPGPGAAVYHATKSYVLSLGEAIAHEPRGTGVTVTVLCPGPTRTGYWEGASATGTRIGRGRLMRAEDVARIGYAALKKGRPVVVAGLRNAASAWSMPLLPRSLLLTMTANLNARTMTDEASPQKDNR